MADWSHSMTARATRTTDAGLGEPAQPEAGAPQLDCVTGAVATLVLPLTQQPAEAVKGADGA